MYVLVCYDIVDDRTRNRVMKALKNFGTRIQLSAFECDLDEEHFTRMKKSLEALIEPKEDRIRYYRLCRGCVKNVEISGWGEMQEEEGFEII